MPRKTYTEELQAIKAAYRGAGQEWPATTTMIASWAFREGLWEPQESDLIHRLADDLAQAMREEWYTDPQGRRVRVMHAAKVRKNGRQLSLWDDLRTMSRQHAEISFRQFRNQIVGECSHLKGAVDSYNQNFNPGIPIPLVLDFTHDVEELDGPIEEKKGLGELIPSAWPTVSPQPAPRSESAIPAST